ncbi:hypothetical protein CEXT_557301 [Caerostris extrusa]|uniref:Uncharacterized protein n=1 Tax=Caerostris extrusa TaxID=172846 RepID=A0AAV4NZM6_CAEEX|nr:hypothetical protein CEXT_557301 [Caerostris extrusa]
MCYLFSASDYILYIIKEFPILPTQYNNLKNNTFRYKNFSTHIFLQSIQSINPTDDSKLPTRRRNRPKVDPISSHTLNQHPADLYLTSGEHFRPHTPTYMWPKGGDCQPPPLSRPSRRQMGAPRIK